MQVTNGDIVGAREALSELARERLPVKTAYWVTKLVRRSQEHLRDIEAVRLKLLNEYGELDQDGKLVLDDKNNAVLSPENRSKFVAGYGELLAETVEMEGLPMTKITLPSDNGLCISAGDMMALEPFVEIEEPAS